MAYLGNQDLQWWVGEDGNIYANIAGRGVKKLQGWVNEDGSAIIQSHADLGMPSDGLPANTRIADPVNPPSAGGTGGSGAAAAPVDPDIAVRGQLRSELAAKGGEIDTIYDSLFGDLDTLVKSRDSELTTQYGGQREKTAKQLTEALPAIDQSYAALGSYDSTQRGDSRGKAKDASDEALKTIGQNESSDKAKLGQYRTEQSAKFAADKESAKRNVARAGETEDVGALRQMRNDVETNISTAGVTKATLGTDGAAKKSLDSLTENAGRYEAAVGALDSILKSSMASDVKAAAVQAVTDSAGLTDEEKKKVQETYGNVYAEQATL